MIETTGVAPPNLSDAPETPISTTVAGVAVAFEVTRWITTLPVRLWPSTVSVTPVPLSCRYGPPGRLRVTGLPSTS